MLEKYFDGSWALRRFRETSFAEHLDSFARVLAESGYARTTARGYICAAAAFGSWAESCKIPPAMLDESAIAQFAAARRWRAGPTRRRPSRFELAYLPRFILHLQQVGVAPLPAVRSAGPALAVTFGNWVSRHRGVGPRTKHMYEKTAADLVQRLGPDPAAYTVASVRAHILAWSRNHGLASTKLRSSITRSFLRFLIVEGRCAPGLDAAVPKVAGWRLAALPRYIDSDSVERLIATCHDNDLQDVRDRAVLLLLARLALRASDVASLRLEDIAWSSGSITVRGKGRRESSLPLPQDVGDALSRYIQGRPPLADPHVFLQLRAPFRAVSPAAVSGIVIRALDRAGMDDVPIRGPHLLRHSAATTMLRAGVSLDIVGSVLRHSSPNTTALYAKVDVAALQTIALPWPATEGA